MKVQTFGIEGPLEIIPKRQKDSRGFFCEFYQQQRYKEVGVPVMVQDNFSYSQKNVIRGLHFQSGQHKLVSVINGCIKDVIVDIRYDSETLGQYIEVEISAKEGNQLYIPCGFAHGFAVLSESAQVFYKVSSFWEPALEGGIRYDDKDLAISWPKEAIISEKDRRWGTFEGVQARLRLGAW
jgi:dTDP-4-dehydrorhamnose 3,5-epimerase